MKPSPAVFVAMCLALAVALVAGCASPAPAKPAPTPETVVAAPTATFAPTATTRPTSTPSPMPTETATPTKVPVSGDVLALLKEAQSKHETIKSARGLMEIKMEGIQKGEKQAVAMTVEFEMNEPNMRMAMTMENEELGAPMDIEFIVADKTGYMKMGGEWMSFPAEEDAQNPLGGNFLDMDEMDDFLKTATNVRLAGKRTVKGVECDVIAFDLPQAEMLELARSQGKLDEDDELPEDLGFEDFKGEFAIGAKDKVMREMVIGMGFFDKKNPRERFDMAMIFTLWDLNAKDIVIKAPAGVKPFGLPNIATPLPRS